MVTGSKDRVLNSRKFTRGKRQRNAARERFARFHRPSLERLEARQLLATFAYSDAYLEATLTDLTSGVAEVVRLRGAVAGQVSESVGSLALEESTQALSMMSLAGFDSERFGAIQVTLNPSTPSFGRVVERINVAPGVLDLPATSEFDVDFIVAVTSYDAPVPRTTTLRPDAPVRIEAGVSELPVGVNDTFRLRGRSVFLSESPAGPALFALSDLALTFRPQFAAISGQKFNDANGNGARDPGESGLNGWTVAAVDIGGDRPFVADAQVTHDVDWNADDVIDPETERGWYQFDGLPPGNYFVTEMLQPGWTQTAPGGTDAPILPNAGPGAGWISDVVARAGSWRAAALLAIDWPDDGNLDGQADEQVFLGGERGAARLGWSGAFRSAPAGPLDSVAAEIGQYSLTGPSSHGQLVMAGGDGVLDFASGNGLSTLGSFQQQAGDTTRATGRFQLDFSLSVGADQGPGGSTLTPQTPIQVDASLDRLPVDGFVFTSTGPSALLNDQLQTTARIVALQWVFFQDPTIDTTFGYQVPLALGRDFSAAHFGNRDLPTGPFGWDFGDAPDSQATPRYPTLLEHDGARHARGGRLYLGAFVDAEDDGTPDVLAIGDDQLHSAASQQEDDEDGVAFVGAAKPGQTLSLIVTASRPGQLDAWVDFNADGDWADAGEQVFTNAPVVGGANALQFVVPGDAAGGTTMTRFRLSSAGQLSFTGAAADGEVEDHALAIHANAAPRDFGDAPNELPDAYPTRFADGGAYHELTTGHYLGDFVDGELDGAASFHADGDDQSGLPDEDGVRLPRPLVVGETGEIEVRASLPGYLNVWIDFNLDGDWNDPHEHVFDALAIAAGTNRLEVAVPTWLDGARASTHARARFRFTADANEGRMPGGGASTGEVEDQLLVITHPPIHLTAGSWNLALGPTLVPQSANAPGVLGLSTSPLEEDALDRRFSELAEQAFFYRLGTSAGESSLGSLRLTDVQVDYAQSAVVLRYGDAAFFDPIQVTVRYSLSSVNLSSVILDEQVIITNLTADPLDLAWFAFTDVNLNGGFGDQDVGRVDSLEAFVQQGQFGSSFELLVTSPPLPDAYQLARGNGLRQSLTDATPTTLDNTPALGATSPVGDVTQAFQWNLRLGVTDEERTALLNLSKQFTVLPVVSPNGGLITGASGGANWGGVVAGDGGGAIGRGGSGGGGSGGSGTAGPAACRGQCVLDPALATGYDYVSDSPNNFAAVRLPFGFGDDEYLLQTPDGSGGWVDRALLAGEVYNFLPEFPQGVSHFRVLGIELAAAVDPRDPLGFPTVITFASAQADWKVRMTGIPDRVYVDPLMGFGEEVNVGAFGAIEDGDVVTFRIGQPQEVTGLVFGQTAFATRAAALNYLDLIGIRDLTEIVEVLADFGDAPLPYPTRAGDAGAIHGLAGGLLLGVGVDDDADGQPSVLANGDDTTGLFDEDGVAFLTDWVQGGTAEIRVSASALGILNAWVDWNDDGDWDDPQEHVFVDRSLGAGDTPLTMAVPATAAIGPSTFSRFRFSSVSGLRPTGIAPDGEVEDYVKAVLPRPELRGRKFADIDANSRRDAGEPFLNGWTIQLLDGADQVIRSTTTADFDINGDSLIDPETERGYYRFVDVMPGTYALREVVPGDWLQTAPDYTASLRGEQVVPASGSQATGAGSFGWDATTSTLAFQIDFDALAGAALGLKLYEGAAGTNGVEIHDLALAAGVAPGFAGPVRGTVTLTASQATKLQAGELYVNLRTVGFPAGELRGQVVAGTVYHVTLGPGMMLEQLDFGNVSSQSRQSSYPASQGQIVLQLPGGGQETLPLVGTSSVRLFVPNDGTVADTDGDGKDDASQELAALALRGFSTLGRIDVSLQTAQRSFGRAEERTNNTAGKLDLPPLAASGSADSFFDVFFRVTVTQGTTVSVYHAPVAARVAGVVTHDPLALGETLTGTGSIELLDENDVPTGIRLLSQSYTPSPIRPWHNIVNRLDIDNSGQVVSLDALLVINELNSPVYSTMNSLPAPVNPALPPPPYFDVTGNGIIESLDALLVINFLNGIAAGEGDASAGGAGGAGEGEASAVARESENRTGGPQRFAGVADASTLPQPGAEARRGPEGNDRRGAGSGSAWEQPRPFAAATVPGRRLVAGSRSPGDANSAAAIDAYLAAAGEGDGRNPGAAPWESRVDELALDLALDLALELSHGLPHVPAHIPAHDVAGAR